MSTLIPPMLNSSLIHNLSSLHSLQHFVTANLQTMHLHNLYVLYIHSLPTYQVPKPQPYAKNVKYYNCTFSFPYLHIAYTIQRKSGNCRGM